MIRVCAFLRGGAAAERRDNRGRGGVMRTAGGLRMSLLMLLALLPGSGCSSYQRVDVADERLHQELRAGNLVRIGEWVEVTLVDGSEHRFQVTGSDADSLRGDGIEVAVVDIAELAVRDFSPARTGALVGGISAAWLVLVTVALSSVTFMM